MAEIRFRKVEKGETKIRNVPIAVTPEGFWCCPSPVMLQKNLKAQTGVSKSKAPQPHHKKQLLPTERRSGEIPIPSEPVAFDDHNNGTPGSNTLPPPVAPGGDKTLKVKSENLPRKVSVQFGEPGTSDLKVVLSGGNHGFSVKMNLHRDVLVANSSLFADRLTEQEPGASCLRIDDCEDVEIYVETIGLMYCKDMRQKLIKQSVQRVLRILKVAEAIGFNACIPSCLDYLEAAPWVGEDEEQKVVSSVLRLQNEGGIIGINPVLKRVSSDVSRPPKDTLSHIIHLVLKSNEERGRREMKSIVLKLLRENNNSCNNNTSYSSGHDLSSPDICYDMIYASCRSCLDSLLGNFRRATEPEFSGRTMGCKEQIPRQIAQEADNLAWLLDILAERQVADEFALMWASQQELAGLHSKLPPMNRCHVSCITARLFVGIGKGELLPSKDTRHMLLQTWLEPLMNDYSWLNHGCRSFDRVVVEEGIGRTILTLPLEDQQSILLCWLSNFLKAGDNCPNLQKAFEVWWRRSFIRPYVAEPRANQD